MHTFKTQVEVQNGDRIGKATVKWVFDYELRDWGIRGLSFFCPDQKITIDYEDGPSEDVSLSNIKISNSKNRGAPRVLNLWRGETILEF